MAGHASKVRLGCSEACHFSTTGKSDVMLYNNCALVTSYLISGLNGMRQAVSSN